MSLKRTLRALFLPAVAGAALVLAAERAEAATRYVFTTFKGDSVSEEKLSVYTSSDGLNFTLLANTGYGGPTGVLRDPTIMKHTDGKYYVAYTLQSWTTSSSSFGIASSTNLTDWTFLVEVPAGIANTSSTWAPEWFKDDDGVHLILNLETSQKDGDFRAYDFRAQDETLLTWDAPVAMNIGPNNIDTFVVRDGATYHAFSKNESTKYIEHATATSFHGPWTWVGKDDWAGWGSGKEGIALFKLDDGRTRMFLDCYSGCGFLYADSEDLVEWSATKSVPSGLSGVRHGTVLREELSDGGMGGGAGMAGSPSSAGRGSGGRANDTGGTMGDGRMNAGRGGASSAAGEGGLGGGQGGGRAGRSGGGASSGGAVSTGGANGGGASGGGASGGAVSTGGASGGRDASGGAVSASGTSSGGTSSGGSTGVDGADGGGCACAVPARTRRTPWESVLALGVTLLWRLRRWGRRVPPP